MIMKVLEMGQWAVYDWSWWIVSLERLAHRDIEQQQYVHRFLTIQV